MTHSKKKNKESLKEKLQMVFSPEGYNDSLSLPPELGGPSQIILTLGKTVFLSGCKGLVGYHPDHITLSMTDGIVTVYGKDLKLKTFSESQLAVIGNIVGIWAGDYREELALENC